MATPGKPRVSGIPGRTGIATPSRSRSSSSVAASSSSTATTDVEYANRAFAAAIKSNDPAQHRAPRPSDASNGRLSPQSSSLGLSERRPVANRPPSVASSRARTPARPHSRQADSHSRSSSRASRSFSVGDDVRIESLGYEGRLRYVGEIDGKPGIWAGVELSGGFHGKGKNDGSVNGKQYFICPPKCGVFVAFSKLSLATAGHVPRPSSVASSYDGRSTPSVSGRVTPSTSRSNALSFSSTGRSTPSTGRATPSYLGKSTPHVGPRKSLRTPGAAPSAKTVPSVGITTGSRASKYANMTAKQLSSQRDGTSLMPPPSPTAALRKGATSPARTIPSPFSTPRSSSRPSLATPRARVPSSVAMPPPPSPKHLHDDLDTTIILRQGSGSRASTSTDAALSNLDIEPAPSPMREEPDQLLSRLKALEYENERLRSSEPAGSPHGELESARAEVERLISHNKDLDSQLVALKSSAEEHQSHLETAIRERDQARQDLDSQQFADSTELADIRARLEQSESCVASMKDAIAVLEGQGHETDSVLTAKTAEITLLENRLNQVARELENERKEKKDLSALVEELRHAGQETIALYEEKLNAMDRDRYDLESRLEAAETVSLQRQISPSSTTSMVKSFASPEQIDNESLREQVQHLQNTIATMEDTMQDLRVSSERDDLALQEKVKRLKDKEESMKKELQDGRQQVQRMSKSEANARTRIEEIEVALRESTVALEMARAEIETLRTQLSDLGASENDAQSSEGAGLTSPRTWPSERSRLLDEIAELQNLLDEARQKERAAHERLTQDDQVEIKVLQDLRDLVDSLEADNSRLQSSNDQFESRVASLQQSLEEKIDEVDALKKKANRDAPAHSGIQDLSKAPANKEEIMGLKHIVQDLQKENRRLESENQGLLSDLDQLRQEVKLLESSLDAEIASPVGDVASLQKKITELENKNAKAVRDLNKEISELEALVESKIYREDELEQEVERLREKASRQKKSSKSSTSSMDPRSRSSEASSIGSSASGDLVCEICERPGHDIFTCDLLKDDGKPTPPVGKDEPWCTDCETSGHLATNCPHSLDVF